MKKFYVKLGKYFKEILRKIFQKSFEIFMDIFGNFE